MTPLEPEHLRGPVLAAAAVAVVAPLMAAGLAALGVGRRSPRLLASSAAGLSFLASLAVCCLWQMGDGLPIEFGERLGGGSLLHIDGLTAVLLPYVTLVVLAIVLVAPRRMLGTDAAAGTLAGAAASVAIFLTAHPGALVVLWIATVLPTWSATRGTPGGRPAARVFAIFMTLSLVCMAVGTSLLVVDPPWARAPGVAGVAGGWLVAVAVMIRKGIVPFHSWYPALFSGAPMSTALMATMPQVGAYTAIRLLVGHADGVAAEIVVLSELALITAVYGAALTLVQRDLRGFMGTLAMSQSALTLAGLSGTLPMELNGAFCMWVSSGLSLTGIGLVSWALESRAGSISLQTPQGRFWDAPALAAFFLLFGMASIGLPGTLSFVADDLLVSGSLDDRLHAGLMVIAAAVLCGIAVMRCWFHVFGGATATDGPQHVILLREKAPLAVLFGVLLALGLFPGPFVGALERAAEQILRSAHPNSAPPAAAAAEPHAAFVPVPRPVPQPQKGISPC